ncbi:DUF4236 domain-containing protein [Bradyrhizobium huanghuaihaiense]
MEPAITRGAHFTIGPRGTRTTIGLPGSGISWTAYQAYSSGDPPSLPHRSLPNGGDGNSNEAASLGSKCHLLRSSSLK